MAHIMLYGQAYLLFDMHAHARKYEKSRIFSHVDVCSLCNAAVCARDLRARIYYIQAYNDTHMHATSIGSCTFLTKKNVILVTMS